MEMINTIIEVSQGKYSENIIVTTKNVRDVLKEIKGKDWSYVVRGKVSLDEKNVTVTFEDGSEWDGVQSADGRLKIWIDTFGGDWRPAFQTIRSTSKGEYITVYKERKYISSIVEK